MVESPQLVETNWSRGFDDRQQPALRIRSNAQRRDEQKTTGRKKNHKKTIENHRKTIGKPVQYRDIMGYLDTKKSETKKRGLRYSEGSRFWLYVVPWKPA